MEPLERITDRVSRNGNVNYPTCPRPLLTLAEFFEGNNVVGSIGCNLTPTPDPSKFYEILSRIAARREVGDIRIQITHFDSEWPFSDTVWIITNAEPEEVVSWFDESVRPNDCGVGWTKGELFEPCAVPPGMKPVACCWD